VEKFGGIWSDDKPVVVDGNLVSSRHPDDIADFIGGIRAWLLETAEQPRTVRGDLGQTEAELEKAGKEQMEHMEGEKPT
jgi:hypothetical protein